MCQEHGNERRYAMMWLLLGLGVVVVLALAIVLSIALTKANLDKSEQGHYWD
jgi:hypothetical protein